MSRGVIVSILALLWAISIGAGSASAASPSMRPDMPPEIQSWRELILDGEEYAKLADAWRAYMKEHPRSAIAHIQLARALRYAQACGYGKADKGMIDERMALIEKAFELDSDCPEALEAIAVSCLTSGKPIVTDDKKAVEYAMRAIALAPGWPVPHLTLWSLSMKQGKIEQGEEHLRNALRSQAFAAPILDFGHNLLVSADPEAIIFTNGDNDTYPPLALQTARGIRDNVLVVNLSLLNLVEYAEAIWSYGFVDDPPFTKAAIRKIHADWKNAAERKGLFAIEVVRALIGKVQDGSWTKPVYFAITVAPPALECCEQTLEIEGILWRVKRERAEAESEETPLVNVAKTLRLFRDDFRMDSATDLAFDWRPEAAATRILRNYPATLRLAATRSAEAGNIEGVRYSLREAIQILDFQGSKDMVRSFVEYWKKLDPENPEIARWQ